MGALPQTGFSPAGVAKVPVSALIACPKRASQKMAWLLACAGRQRPAIPNARPKLALVDLG